MNRVNRAIIALSVCGGLLGAANLYAHQAKTEPLKPILSGKFTPPVRGQAEIQMLKPKIERKGKQIVTTMQVKNMSSAPIAGLKCDEIWYDAQGSVIAGGDSWRAKKLIEPGEIVTFTLTGEVDPRVKNNNYQFAHSNGNIKVKQVSKF